MNAGDAEVLTTIVSNNVKRVYDKQKAELGQLFEQIARVLLLQTIDQRWKEHLEYIDHLKEGIHLRGYAQKDPLIEYKKEAFDAFQNMNRVVREESIEKLVKIRLVDRESAREMLEERPEIDQEGLVYAGAEEGPSDFFDRGDSQQAQSRAPIQGGLPLARPVSPGPQMMTYSDGDGDDFRPGGDGQRLNREQRRRMEKKAKKKKLKI